MKFTIMSFNVRGLYEVAVVDQLRYYNDHICYSETISEF